MQPTPLKNPPPPSPFNDLSLHGSKTFGNPPPSATDFKKVQPLPYRQGGDTHYGYIVVQGKTVPLSTLP